MPQIDWQKINIPSNQNQEVIKIRKTTMSKYFPMCNIVTKCQTLQNWFHIWNKKKVNNYHEDMDFWLSNEFFRSVLCMNQSAYLLQCNAPCTCPVGRKYPTISTAILDVHIFVFIVKKFASRNAEDQNLCREPGFWKGNSQGTIPIYVLKHFPSYSLILANILILELTDQLDPLPDPWVGGY